LDGVSDADLARSQSHHARWSCLQLSRSVLFNCFCFIAHLSDLAPHSFVCYWKIVPTFGAVTQADSWVYFAVGTLLWAYQAFDNMDGKQARRTGSSSALGELVPDEFNRISS
jgi:phosphatidylglycerophosphate synthase